MRADGRTGRKVRLNRFARPVAPTRVTRSLVGGRSWAIGLGLLALLGCKGEIGGSDDTPGVDGGPSTPCTEEQTLLQEQVGNWLETTCSHAGCHGPVGARRPDIAAGTLPELIANNWFVPGDPEAGAMERIDPADPHDIMPPTRLANPPEAIAMLEQWIELGARTDCVELPPLPETAPNSYPQDELFTCDTPTSFAPTHALMSRNEFIHRAGGYLQDPELAGSPLPSDARPFSTGTLGDSLDSTLLGLHLDVLDTSRGFRQSDRTTAGDTRDRRGENEPNRVWMKGLTDAERTRLECLTDSGRAGSEVLADGACKREFVGLLLERHAMQRRATETEIDQLVSFLDVELGSESDPSHRIRTQDRVTEASMMMFGALHRSLLGGDDGQLTPDEWSHELASALGTAPLNGAEIDTVERPELGWVGDYRQRRDDGELATLSDATAYIGEVLSIDAGYVGGEHAASAETARPDIYYDERTRGDWRRPRRGRYWLAPQIARFFREYFDYAKAPTIAKDDPAATSRWDAEWMSRFMTGPVNDGYTLERDGANPNRPAHGEPPMVDQLDDFIARVVVDAERAGRDVFQDLLTARTYRVPASLTATEGFQGRGVRSSQACDPTVCQDEGDANCCDTDGHSCAMVGFAPDGTPLGGCMGLSFRLFHFMASVYDVNPIEESEAASMAVGDDAAIAMDPAAEARWVTMPEGQRAGVLTHPAWLTAHGGNGEDGPSAVLRGHWIREHLFCQDVAGLDLVNLEAQLAPAEENDRARDRMVATFGDLSLPPDDRTAPNPLCANAACHGRMNELGLSFEVFNHAGFLRDDDHGQPPDGSAYIRNWPGGSGPVAVDSAVELTELLAEDPYARRCFLRHVFRFFARRYETPADACVLADMESAFAEGSFLAALEALLTHESFMVRDGGDR